MGGLPGVCVEEAAFPWSTPCKLFQILADLPSTSGYFIKKRSPYLRVELTVSVPAKNKLRVVRTKFFRLNSVERFPFSFKGRHGLSQHGMHGE